ncbi:MAG TPA: tyrosine/phenylalanine carboxypeptidase domain-containing protein [Candidatus Absconditabacterales bacterium]|nr:tyrosine/phenylalanine carboxypeptidase domain-containing protein [Candidatus Absconditabacterales bacterium]
MLNFGILGNNARNLLYIKKFNDKKSIRLANNKINTKNFLSARGIPFAKTYAIIKDRKELFNIDFGKLPNKEFVIKPNKGSKGKGIYIAKFLGTVEKNEKGEVRNIFDKAKLYVNKIADKIQNLPNLPHYYEIGGEMINDNTFRRYVLDNLDGKNSMTIGGDKVIVEEKIQAGEGFTEFCKHGLADIRIIVFNLVPVSAMVRMPTYKSEGKANLAKGGIGLGIEIGIGKISSMFENQKIYKGKFKEEFKSLKGHKLPYWDDILFLSSKIQYFVNLGYLALDWVITEDGPKLLEINARAGLEVQNISGMKLKNTLNKISDLKISDPEKGVEIAKSLFSKEATKGYTDKILYLSQHGKLNISSEKNLRYDDLIVKVNINKSENYVSKEIFQGLKDNPKSETNLNLYDNDIHIKNIKFLMDETLESDEIVLGKSISSNFLIKPINKTKGKINIINTKDIKISEKNKLHIIDEKISRIGKKLILAKILKPINYFEELDKFIINNGKYNPKFEYKWPEKNKLENMTKELIDIKDDLQKNDYNQNFSKLFENKIEDLLYRINLINAYKNKDYKNILLYNEKLFGKIDEKLLKISKEKIFEGEPENKQILGKILSVSEVKRKLEKYLSKKGIEGVDTIITSTTLARISVSMGKNTKIKINRMVPFQEKEIDSIFAHEIDTHLIRYINGSKTGRNIFKEGSGFYIKDEEGLAIYNANKHLPSGYQKLSFYKKYFLLKEAQKYSFSKLVDLVKFLYPEKRMEWVFMTILRLKKGIQDTSVVNEGAIFMKEKVYLDGYMKVKDWAEKGGEVEEMYKGKINVEDLNLIG